MSLLHVCLHINVLSYWDQSGFCNLHEAPCQGLKLKDLTPSDIKSTWNIGSVSPAEFENRTGKRQNSFFFCLCPICPQINSRWTELIETTLTIVLDLLLVSAIELWPGFHTVSMNQFTCKALVGPRYLPEVVHKDTGSKAMWLQTDLLNPTARSVPAVFYLTNVLICK